MPSPWRLGEPHGASLLFFLTARSGGGKVARASIVSPGEPVARQCARRRPRAEDAPVGTEERLGAGAGREREQEPGGRATGEPRAEPASSCPRPRCGRRPASVAAIEERPEPDEVATCVPRAPPAPSVWPPSDERNTPAPPATPRTSTGSHARERRTASAATAPSGRPVPRARKLLPASFETRTPRARRHDQGGARPLDAR